jgi:small subunit ribosomal protein S4
MGDPRKSKKLYSRPKAKFNKERIDQEKVVLREFGLRRKKELWKVGAIVRDLKGRAKALLANKNEVEEKVLLDKVKKYGFIQDKDLSINNLLELNIDNVLNRRLQSIVVKLGFANTMKQARQFIVHGHIVVNGRVSNSPSRFVKVEEEDLILFKPNSKLNASFIKAEKVENVNKISKDVIIDKDNKSELVKDVKEDDKTKDVEAKDDKTKDVKVKDDKTKDVKAKDDKTKDVKVKDDKTKDVKVKDDKTKDVKVKDDKTKDVKAKDDKTKDVEGELNE